MVIALFKTKMRADADLAAYEKLGLRMYDLASKMEGFVSLSDASLPDGESLAIAAFASPQALEAWRRHPEHLEAQRQGRERFYEAYSVKVCEVTREYEWRRTP
jgi:heme-degrading monooxygenase HmoA